MRTPQSVKENLPHAVRKPGRDGRDVRYVPKKLFESGAGSACNTTEPVPCDRRQSEAKKIPSERRLYKVVLMHFGGSLGRGGVD